eukprot:COSAG01_NODE_200_length_22187_cov_59.140529_11_plen_211_part_00
MELIVGGRYQLPSFCLLGIAMMGARGCVEVTHWMCGLTLVFHGTLACSHTFLLKQWLQILRYKLLYIWKAPTSTVAGSNLACCLPLLLLGVLHMREFLATALFSMRCVVCPALPLPYALKYCAAFQHGLKMSKSVGNVIDPDLVINGGSDPKSEPAYGADVIRMWVASTDYKRDVLIGPATLAAASTSLRKVRSSTGRIDFPRMCLHVAV